MITVLKTMLVAGLALVAVESVASSAGLQMTVRLADPTPVTLRGVGFVPYESVRLEVRLGEELRIRKLRAGQGGGFREVFSALRYDRCHGALAIRAVGARGSRVSWKIVPLECPARDDVS